MITLNQKDSYLMMNDNTLSQEVITDQLNVIVEVFIFFKILTNIISFSPFLSFNQFYSSFHLFIFHSRVWSVCVSHGAGFQLSVHPPTASLQKSARFSLPSLASLPSYCSPLFNFTYLFLLPLFSLFRDFMQPSKRCFDNPTTLFILLLFLLLNGQLLFCLIGRLI